jgi:hypothetical protein
MMKIPERGLLLLAFIFSLVGFLGEASCGGAGRSDILFLELLHVHGQRFATRWILEAIGCRLDCYVDLAASRLSRVQLEAARLPRRFEGVKRVCHIGSSEFSGDRRMPVPVLRMSGFHHAVFILERDAMPLPLV